MKMSIDKKNNSVTFLVNTNVYSKGIIYKACYVFIDRMYIFLDVSSKKNELNVTLKGKATLTKGDIGKMEGEFLNELLNSMVRESISKQNQKVLEQIVGGAMAASLGLENVKEADEQEDCAQCDSDEAKEIEEAVAALRLELSEIESSGDYEGDTLGIREIFSGESKTKPSPVKKAAKQTVNKKKNNGKGKEK